MLAKFIRTMTIDAPDVLRERLSIVVQNNSLHTLAQQVYRPETFAGKGSTENEMNAFKLVMGGNSHLNEAWF